MIGSGLLGCDRVDPGNTMGRLDKIYGRQGIIPGRFNKPRAMAIDDQDRLFIVDFLARIHVFSAEGEFLYAFRTPEWATGKPTGLTIEGDRLRVADTHYYRILNYTLDGQLVEDETIGGTLGHAPGEFGLVTDAVHDSTGNLYVSEYGDHDRIQKFSPTGEFLLQWGTHGRALGEFVRPQNMVMDADDRLWVCDACNHRFQVFDTSGKLLTHWGEEGTAPGQLYYPYDAIHDPDGNLYVVEYGNHRIQKFTPDGKSLGTWGHQGRSEGELWNPWSLAMDSRGRLHVLDSNNHRVQRVVV